MTRSISKHLSEMVAKQIRMNQTLEEHGVRLAEIAASLAALTKAFVPPVTTETSPDAVGSPAVFAPSSDGQPHNVTSSLTALTKALAPPVAEENSSDMASLDAAATSTFGTGLCNTSLTTLPSFDGEDPIGWVARAEHQIELSCTPPGKKVAATVVVMEGSALYRLTSLRARKPGMSWDELTQALVARFDSRFKGNCFERLSGGKQSGTMEEYISIFPKDTRQPPGTNVSRFPDFNLEDKVFSKGDGIDMKQNLGLEEEGQKPPWVYRRRDGLEPTFVGWLRAV
ncbi:unnamed protein product [Cuscuta epithymum]|uniref:Retrotransposon gag domain-containing protein n=1 Tax=Cuscuta epithymum TaxID=186058 RepID=A0AAV0FUN7_9ASTE|nr:unnamed protein product [Cuscuta epithymum]